MKTLDRDSIKAQVKADSLSPLFFLNDESREQFWGLLDACRDSIESRALGGGFGTMGNLQE